MPVISGKTYAELVQAGQLTSRTDTTPPKAGQVVTVGSTDITSTASLAATNATLTVPVAAGMATCLFDAGQNAWAGTCTFQYSINGGTTYRSLQAVDPANSTSTTSTFSGPGVAYEAAIPAGATHLRLLMSAYTSGSAAVTIGQSQSSYEPGIAANIVGTPNVTTSANSVTQLSARSAGGGPSIQRVISSTSGVAKAAAGNLYGIHVRNLSAATKFLKLYNVTTLPALGAGTPVATYAIPAGATLDIDSAMSLGSFSTGIVWRFTANLADTDTTDGTAGDLVGTIHFA